MIYEIENSVPAPKPKRGNHLSISASPFTSTLRALQPGQSFVAPTKTTLACRRIWEWRVYHGMSDRKFTVRKEADGCRVWRIA